MNYTFIDLFFFGFFFFFFFLLQQMNLKQESEKQ